jgi:hypothetical protein
MRAAEIFEPATPIKIREPRPFGLGKVMVVLLLAVIGFGVYRLVSTNDSHGHASARGTTRPSASAPAKPHVTTQPVVQHPAQPEAVIKLTANQDCWVGLTNAAGVQIYQGIIPAGSSMTWKEKHPVSLVVGNPPGVVLTVDGKAQQMNPNQVATLAIDPSQHNPVTSG